MKNKYYIFSLCISFALLFLLPFQTYAQQSQIIQGVVVDETGEPIIGATVKVDGLNTGTITDVNGHFKIGVPSKGKLTVSFIGYLSQTIMDLSNPKVVLKEDIAKLDEVVVVGYGTQKMKNVTGSVATLNPQDISDLSTSNLGVALSGQINGLDVSGGDSRPGQGATLTVRQADISSAFSPNGGSSDPLYVIDDYICPTDGEASGRVLFNNLESSMIESVTVLRDASAAVYGARSAQGVILVKTKRGKIGAPKISYSGQFGFTDQITKTKMLNAYDYGNIWNGVAGAASYDDTTIGSQTGFFQADELSAMKNLNYDLLKEHWSSAATQKHAVNISGGNESATYFAGASYFTQDGNLGWLNYSRWNYNAGIDTKINKWTKASLKVSGDYGKQANAYNKIGGSSNETDYNVLLTHPRYIPESINGYPMATYGVTNTLVNDIQNYNYTAIQDLNNYSKSTPQNMSINAALEYDFGWNKWLNGLKLRVTYAKNISTTKNNVLGTNVTTYKMLTRGGSGNHLYTGVDGIDLSSANFESIVKPNGNGISRTMNRTDGYQLNFYATYARKFGNHDINALFTIERSENEMEDLSGTVQDPLSFTNAQSTSASGAQSTDFGRSESGSLSYVGRVNYAYKDRYLVEFLVRSDASTKFAPENYWGTFPSLSLGWVMSEEDWFKKSIHWIDYLKLRGSFGLLGHDNIPSWGWVQTYSRVINKGAVFGTNQSSNIGSAIQSSDAPNRAAHWDKSYQMNFGFDSRLINDRLSVNLDAYYNMGRDVFMSRSGADFFPSTVGTKPTAENFGSIDTYGIELSFAWKDKIGKDFKYFVRLSTGYSDNKLIKKYWPSQIAIDEQHPNERSDVGIWGYDCIGIFRSYQQINEYVKKYNITKYMGMSTDKIRPGMLIYRDVRGSENSDNTYQPADGIVNENDRVQISKRSSNPYGFTTNFGGEWKGLSFSVQMNASWGSYSIIPKSARSGLNTVSSSTKYSDLQYTNVPSFWANNMFVYSDIKDASGSVVAASNVNAKYPNMAYNTNNETSTFWAVSGTRVTIRTASVAYTVPKSFVKKLSFESCRLNLTCQNVLSLYNPYPDHFMDPMSGTYGNYPSLRTITMGINVSF